VTTHTSQKCYLCGLVLTDEDDINRDHVFTQQFITRPNPKAKGYKYCGVLRTHLACNSAFGRSGADAEAVCQQALKLLHVLKGPNALYRQHRDRPDINTIAISTDGLDFTPEEVAYFGLNDVSGMAYEDWSRPEYIETQPRVKPYERVTRIALGVLAKSAAAALIRFKRNEIPAVWRILAVPFFGEEPERMFAPKFKEHLKIEDDVDLWVGQTDRGG
jgi:hypothetical protein